MSFWAADFMYPRNGFLPEITIKDKFINRKRGTSYFYRTFSVNTIYNEYGDPYIYPDRTMYGYGIDDGKYINRARSSLFVYHSNTKHGLNDIINDSSNPNGAVEFPNQFYIDGINVTAQQYVNEGPVVVPPNDATVSENTLVTLSAAESYDPEGDELTYSWTQVSGPSVIINDANTSIANFTTRSLHHSDPEDVYEFTVTVSDGINEPVTSPIIKVTSTPNPNQAPMTPTLTTLSVKGGETITINDTTTYDPDGDELTFTSTQISGPTVTITDMNSRDIEVSFPTLPYGTSDNVAIIDTIVSDGLLSSTRRYSIAISTEPNTSPIANAGLDKVVSSGSEVILSGIGSSDPEGVQLSYNWILKSTTGQTVTIVDSNTVSPSFVAPTLNQGDSDTVLIFTLTVSDGELTSSDDVKVTVRTPFNGVYNYCPSNCNLFT
jgi:hypothetical protein